MISRATMGNLNKGNPDAGITPSKVKREKPANAVRVTGAVEGSGKNTPMAKNAMGHGERCATAGGHLMGKC